jgi:hypothetical protein
MQRPRAGEEGTIGLGQALRWTAALVVTLVLLPVAALLFENARLGRAIERIVARRGIVLSNRGILSSDRSVAARLPWWLQRLIVVRQSYDVALGTTGTSCVRGETYLAFHEGSPPGTKGVTASDGDVALVRALGRVRMLTLIDTAVTDAGLRHLRGLDTLRSLYLDGTRVAGPGLVHLRGLPLELLVLRATELDDAGLAALDDLPHLQQLDLGRTRITSAGLAHLPRFPELATLYLDHTGVDDDGLRHLVGLPLKELRLTDTAVSDAGLAHLARLPTLVYLYLCRTRATSEGVSRLRHFLKGDIRFDPDC